MTWNTGYLIINALVVPAWLMLIVLPRAAVTRQLVHSMLWPIVMGLLYIGFLSGAMFFGLSAEGVGFTSISGVMALFDHPNGTLTGWTHYLVFDLFVGAWIGRDAARRDLHHGLIIPCLLGTFIFGPVGLFLYAVLRLVTGHGFSLDETDERPI